MNEYVYRLVSPSHQAYHIELRLPIWLPCGSEFLYNSLAYRVDSYNKSSKDSQGKFGCSIVGNRPLSLAEEANMVLDADMPQSNRKELTRSDKKD